jgi:hypothetical protein
VRLAIRGTPDTVRFEVPVVAQRCGPGHGLLLHGEQRDLGVLVWLRDAGNPDTGTYPLVSRGDTETVRGAIAAVRFLVGGLASGITINDGSVTLTRATPPLALRAEGMGVETRLAQQRFAELTVEGVPLLPDTTPCLVEL